MGLFGGVSLLLDGEGEANLIALGPILEDSLGDGGLTVGEAIGVSGLMIVSGLLMRVDMTKETKLQQLYHQVRLSNASDVKRLKKREVY